MLIPYLRRLTGKDRSPEANLQLARYLAFVAGATNAGGFLAVQQYTSHMSGILSAMADNLALGSLGLVLDGLGALIAFLSGAACSAVLINWGRREQLQSTFALPLMVEAGLLVSFGLLGGNLEHHEWLFVPATVLVLCFIMGLQNAMVTKVSNAEIRTTHVTGMVTDIGIELGKLFYWNLSRADSGKPVVLANRQKLRVLATLVGLFFVGGVVGALGFKHIGFSATLPLAILLLALAAVPVVDDVRLRMWRQDFLSRIAARARRWARTVKTDIHAIWLAARDPRTPWYAKVLAAVVAGYALSPIDLIPDFIPVIGYLDDVVLVPLGILVVIRLIPEEVMKEHRAAASSAERRPASKMAAAAIIVIWTLSAFAIAHALPRLLASFFHP
ncbi:DUF1275 domain-containing transporter [Cupriavidus metallidurans]|uniref:DUF1232 domain-containing protein n=1 Tax=Cupriavidus metallidurans (strain ATCC 43123 / DSM 2839 / NBRC 102507 / CH34) TaxID=266264 RepID=Q1LEA2_CUPMC|nr:DUF1275 domain-containing transporter [Cupriavidus metallidurans]ABF11524.1 conserved hypothetical protein, putative membrane protein [Cupriavidus metallidurans CH34]QGS31363.1 DUF1275 domain-containing transporter [Cupriavidus metallidurans]UBM08000.1 DUF1275 domain-containing transporter [Cupriavidus metallidurans]